MQDFGDGGKTYDKLLEAIISYCQKHFPRNAQQLKDLRNEPILVRTQEEHAKIPPLDTHCTDQEPGLPMPSNHYTPTNSVLLSYKEPYAADDSCDSESSS